MLDNAASLLHCVLCGAEIKETELRQPVTLSGELIKPGSTGIVHSDCLCKKEGAEGFTLIEEKPHA